MISNTAYHTFELAQITFFLAPQLGFFNENIKTSRILTSYGLAVIMIGYILCFFLPPYGAMKLFSAVWFRQPTRKEKRQDLCALVQLVYVTRDPIF